MLKTRKNKKLGKIGNFKGIFSLTVLFLFLFATFALAVPPTHDEPLLSSTSDMDLSIDDLTVTGQNTYDADNDPVKDIINWKKDGSSITILNIPFEGGSTSAYSKDYSGYGNDASVTSATWNPTAGFDGEGAYVFDGVDDIIDLGQASSLETFNAFTVSAWALPNGPSDNSPGCEYMVADGYRFALYWDHEFSPYKNSFAIHTGEWATGTWYNAGLPSQIVSEGQWHHFAGVFDSDTLYYYIDGDLMASTYIGPQTLCAEDPVGTAIGGVNNYGWVDPDWVYTTNCHFDGAMDEVAIYNTPLSAEQVEALYADGTDKLVSQETALGDVWEACITPNDGTSDGTEKCSNALTILPDTDGDEIGDAEDICPNDAANLCNVDSDQEYVETTEAVTLETQNGEIELNIDAGDLAEDTLITIEANPIVQPNFDLQTNTGGGIAVFSYLFSPEGTSFNSPIVVTMTYPDTNQDGIVDGFENPPAVKEKFLDIYWYNPVTTQWEAQGADCDAANDYTANACTVEIDHFSQYSLGGIIDSDNDGVYDENDKCPSTTLPESVSETLRPNHYSDIDGDLIFETNTGDSSLTIIDTYGCSCEQILTCKPGNNEGEYKFGCTEGTMNVWTSQTAWSTECLVDEIVIEGEAKDLLENTDNDGAIDLIDSDNDGDGLIDSEDSEPDSASTGSENQGDGKPDWWCEKHPTKC
ncbi:MAG: LamG domain-containing protein [archaeon]